MVDSAHSLTRIEMGHFKDFADHDDSAQEVLLDFLRPATALQYLDASSESAHLAKEVRCHTCCQ